MAPPRTAASVDPLEPTVYHRALARARRRLIPFLFLLYIVAYLDRINVGFAALQMNAALGFSATTYGFGAGVFFLSYVLFEVPSNIVLARIGARPWIARIMISWGLVSSAMMFVRGAAGFYTLRFLLGLAEAGFFPGIIFYLTRWFPAAERARTLALFLSATIVAGVVGGPMSGALLTLNGVAGLAGWQWLFLLEGLPAIGLGVIVLCRLDETPNDAAWLPADERLALAASLDRERASHAGQNRAPLRDRRTWTLAVLYFVVPVALYAIAFWLPQLVRSASGAGDFTVGLLSAIPYAIASIGMVLVGRHSDRVGERRRHVMATALLCAAGLALNPLGRGTLWTVCTLSLALLGVASMMAPFWALATSTMYGVDGAAAIALINSVGNTGGFVGPYLLGALNDVTHSFAAGLLTIAGILAAGGVLALTVDD
jgi:MFS transporter, ACS family, tartrate transporter